MIGEKGFGVDVKTPDNRGDQEKNEKKERGRNVKIVIKFIRHGERDLDGNLTDLGRKITGQKAEEQDISKGEFDAVKAIGSDAGPKSDGSGMARAMETADIYAHKIEGDEASNSRINNLLSYETIVTLPPYDHRKVYNSFIPENYDEMNDEERLAAAFHAQTQTTNYVFAQKGPEAEKYKKEVAGSFACIIDHYERMTKKLKNGSEVLLPAGTHGGTMEFILQKALVYKGQDGKMHTGFEDIDEIGGAFDTSESYNVDITTDDDGNVQDVSVSFDNSKRPQGEMSLDMGKVKELADFYKGLHEEDKEA